jgi:HK97 family phage prohead protease
VERRQFDGLLEVREDGTERIIEGIAVPYNTPVDVPQLGMREQFAPGSVDVDALIGKPLLYRHGEPAGVIKAARETREGVRIDARVAATSFGDDLLTLTREGAIQGFSVGFNSVQDSYDAATKTITREGVEVGEVSLAVFPVYPSAAITGVRETPTEGVPVSDTTTAPTTPVVDDPAVIELREQITAVQQRLNDTATLQVREALPFQNEHEFWTAYVNDGLNGSAEQREKFSQHVRAITDIEVSDAAGYTSATRWTDDILRLVNNGRRTAEAIGIGRLAETGLTVDYIEQTAGVATAGQTAEFNEIGTGQYTSLARSSAVFTEAGGNRVSLQLLQRSSPDFRTELMRDFVRAYATRWNARVVTLLNTASVTNTLDADSATEPTTTQLGKFLAETATDMVAGCGGDIDVIVLAPDFFFTVAAVSGNGYPVAGGNVGNAGLRDYSYSAMGITFVRDNALTAGTGYAINRGSVGLKESAGAPMSLTVDTPSTLSQDIAVYGFGAAYLRDSGGVIKLALDTTP